MMNLKEITQNAKLNIIVGVLLLIFAFFIIMTSNSNADSKIEENFTQNTESTTNHIDIETTSTEETTVEETTAKKTQKQLKKLINFDTEYPYFIRINLDENFAIVYGMDKKGRHTIPYKAFICSTGLEEGDTPTGVFEMSDKYRWRLMVDGTYAQYAIRLKGQIMLHSVPYVEPSSDTLEYWEYNKLGKPASLGCVRFRAATIKWIYDNCKAGTKVEIYSEPGEVPPLEIPKIKKIKKSSPNSGWDPTDPLEGNPWKEKTTKKKNSKKHKSESETTLSDNKEQSTDEMND